MLFLLSSHCIHMQDCSLTIDQLNLLKCFSLMASTWLKWTPFLVSMTKFTCSWVLSSMSNKISLFPKCGEAEYEWSSK